MQHLFFTEYINKNLVELIVNDGRSAQFEVADNYFLTPQDEDGNPIRVLSFFFLKIRIVD